MSTTKSNHGIIKSKTQEEKEELETNKKIKPHLRKFVMDYQRNKAKQTAEEKFAREEKLNKMQAEMEAVVHRAKALSLIAFTQKKVWKQHPPYFEMKWLTSLTVTPELEQAQKIDMWGFAQYLTREYFSNYLKEQDSEKGYPNPMKEENLEWFWVKFNADLKLLIKAEMQSVAKGNKSNIIVTKENKTPNIILPNKTKFN